MRCARPGTRSTTSRQRIHSAGAPVSTSSPHQITVRGPSLARTCSSTRRSPAIIASVAGTSRNGHCPGSTASSLGARPAAVTWVSDTSEHTGVSSSSRASSGWWARSTGARRTMRPIWIASTAPDAAIATDHGTITDATATAPGRRSASTAPAITSAGRRSAYDPANASSAAGPRTRSGTFTCPSGTAPEARPRRFGDRAATTSQRRAGATAMLPPAPQSPIANLDTNSTATLRTGQSATLRFRLASRSGERLRNLWAASHSRKASRVRRCWPPGMWASLPFQEGQRVIRRSAAHIESESP